MKIKAGQTLPLQNNHYFLDIFHNFSKRKFGPMWSEIAESKTAVPEQMQRHNA